LNASEQKIFKYQLGKIDFCSAYESFILSVFGIDKLKIATQWDSSKQLIRLHIG